MKNYENVTVKEVEVSSVILPCKQEEFDYVINPYTGCPNPCKYCYASFMRRFSRHSEEWGKFLDVKIWKGKFDAKRLEGKRILIASVTEPYNFFEKKYKVTRDMDILKKLQNVTVSVSFCTLNEKIAKEIEGEYPVKDRLKALKILHENGVKTSVNVAPIMPGITDWKEIVDKTSDYTNSYFFESLTLRNEFKPAILNYIWAEHKDLYATYYEIYKENRSSYFDRLFDQIDEYCEEKNLQWKNSFKLQ